MNCTACGHVNPTDADFCEECGADLPRACVTCGTANTATAKFCKRCRAPLGGSATSPSPADPVRPAAPPLPTSFAAGRYTVKSFLGEGGRKRVYLAHDEKLDRDVAFSAIKTEGLDEAGVTRIRREAQSMGKLGDHANIVTVFDTGEDLRADGVVEPYIVSQYMAGGELTGLIDSAERRRVPIADAVRIATQIAHGLEHAHKHGIVHRDLKPGNVWLTDTGIAKIGDFGLALALANTRMTVQGTMVGTAAYMPPEQAMGGTTTASSDLYALGCILYEMVSGRPPFVGDDVVAVISQHVNTPPVAPTWHTPECPPALETLITRLLTKDPAGRPKAAAEVIQALSSVVLPSASAITAAPSEEAAAGGIYQRTFVGREPEMKQLQAAFDGALAGQGALVMVVGEPGIGKTTVTEQLLTYVAMRGGRAYVGHCYEEGSLALPYLPFVETMRSYALERGKDELAEELGTGAGDVARIVSEVRDLIAVEMPPPGNPEEERFRLFQAVTAFLRNASAAQAMCIVLEDLQDGDKGTMELLVHLARNLAGARLLIVGTYRDVEVDRRHPLSAALADLRRVESFTRIPLRGLNINEVHRMLSNLAGHDVQMVLAEAIFRQTEGNPLFIQEVARYIAEAGLIKRENGQWVAGTDSLLAQIPEGLRDVIGKRLTRLSEDCNRILSVGAVMGRDFSLDVLRDVASVPEEELLSAIEEAMNVSLLEEHTQSRDVRYRFTHAYFRQTLYGEMIAPRRLRLHNEVAKALERHYASRLEEHAAELAEHFSHSSTLEDLSKAVFYGQLAAERANGVYAFGEAARLLEQALQVQEVLDPNDKVRRFDLLHTLSEALLSAGEAQRVSGDLAPEMFDIALALADNDRVALAANRALDGLIYYDAGPVFASPEWALWIKRLYDHSDPESPGRVNALMGEAWSHYPFGRLREHFEVKRQALELARRINDPDALAWAMTGFMTGQSPPELEGERAAVMEEFLRMPRVAQRPGYLAQNLAMCVGHLTEASQRALRDDAFRELEAYAGRVADPYVRVWLVISQANRLTRAGELERVVEIGQDLGAPDRAAGENTFALNVSNTIPVGALRLLGRFDDALAAADSLRTWVFGEAARALLQACSKMTDEARASIRRVVAERNIKDEDDWTDTATLIFLLAASNEVRDTETAAMLYRRLSGFERLYSLDFNGTVARQLGLAALLASDPETARSYFKTALEVAAGADDRTETALLNLDLARLLFENYPDKRAEAREHLNFALNEFQAMKMQPALEEAMRLRMRDQGISAESDVYTSIVAVADSVQRERPDIAVHAAPDGTVTIMFSDIEDSTVLTERLGDQAWQDLLRKHNALIREQLRAHGGYEVKTMGDGFMVAFNSAKKALDCALAIQKAFGAGADRSEDLSLQDVRVRIGLHAGEAIKDGDDFYGKNVIMASRVAGKAVGGEILVSSLVRALVESSVEPGTFSDPRDVELKGLSGNHTVYAVKDTAHA